MATIGYPAREQHEPSWRCDDLHCYSHNVESTHRPPVSGVR